MPRVKLDPQKCVLTIIDIQPTLTKTIFESSRVLERVAFLAKVANHLRIPVLTTEQNPSRMGNTCDELQPFLDPTAIYSKMTFNSAALKWCWWERKPISASVSPPTICLIEASKSSSAQMQFPLEPWSGTNSEWSESGMLVQCQPTQSQWFTNGWALPRHPTSSRSCRLLKSCQLARLRFPLRKVAV